MSDFYCALVSRYDEGRGVEKDDTEAAKWFRKSADQGNAISQFLLGAMHDEGRGVKKDGRDAVKLYACS